MSLDQFLDTASPCPCPQTVIELLDLAVRYTEASLGSAHPDSVLGAQYVKDFMEQPSEVWCAFVRAAGLGDAGE